MPTVTRLPVRTPQPRHRPPLPPPHWAVIDAYIAAHGLPPWTS